MVPLRLEREEMIEGRDAVDAAERELQTPCDIDEQIVIQEAEYPLRDVKNFYKSVAAGLVSCDSAVEQLEPVVAARMRFLLICRRHVIAN